MTTEEYKNAVPSVSQPTTILILSDSEAPGWCEQVSADSLFILVISRLDSYFTCFEIVVYSRGI